MTTILRKNLISVLNDNLFPVVIRMRISDFQNINIHTNDFIMKTINNNFIVKSHNFQEIYKTNICNNEYQKNNIECNELKTSCTSGAFVLKKLLLPEYKMAFIKTQYNYSITINTHGEIPHEWLKVLYNTHHFDLFYTSYTKSNTTIYCENIINDLTDDDVIKLDKKLRNIMDDKYFNNCSCVI